MENFNSNNVDNNLEKTLNNEAVPVKTPEQDLEALYKNKNFLAKTKEVIASINEAFHDTPIGLKAILISGVALFTAFPAIEYGKRLCAEDEYKKAKDMLNEYVINNSPETVDEEKLNKAMELFGSDNMSWFDYDGDFTNDTADINRDLRRYENKKNVFDYSYNTYSLTKFFTKNEHIEDLKEIQDRVNTISGFGSRDSTDIVYGENTAVGFRDGNNPEEFDTLRQETFKKIIYETYPKNWFVNEVDAINLSNNKLDHNQKYAENSITTAQFNNADERMDFFGYKDLYENSPDFVFGVLSHEAAHANDWDSNESLTPNQRLELALNIANRLDDKDRFMSEYVEELIVIKDSKDKLYTKTTEYWGEICEEYFTNGKGNLSPKDVEIIEKIIKIKDPDFNVDEAISKRVNIIQQDVYKKSPQEIAEFNNVSKLNSLLGQRLNEQSNFYEQNSDVIEEFMVAGIFVYDSKEGVKNPILDKYAQLEAQVNYSMDAFNGALRRYEERHRQNTLLDAINAKYSKF
jgi:hypothetical protein